MRSTANLRALLALSFMAALTACGGGSSGEPPASVTHAGTASVSGGSSGAAVQSTVVSVDGERALVRAELLVTPQSAAAGTPRMRALAAAAPGTQIIVDPGQQVRLISYAYFNIFTCQIINSGKFNTPIAPQHGTLQTGSINLSLTGSCAGVTAPYTTSYYTWNESDPSPTATEDPFELQFLTTDGVLLATTAWNPTVRLLPVDPEKEPGGCLADDITTCTCPKGTEPCNEAGNPAMVSRGNKFQVEHDLTAAPHTGISLTRYYNSIDTRVSGFGAGWRSQWHRSLTVVAGGPVKFTREDGRTVKFVAGAGGYVSDGDVTSRLSATGSGWLLVRADDSVEAYSADGRLLSITTRSGRVTTLAYDVSNRLSTVTGPFGHTLGFVYTGNLITQVTGPDGGLYQYQYDAANNLTSVRYPDSTVTTYVHENPFYPILLTGVVDGLGNRFATYTYDRANRVASTQHGVGVELTTMTYNPNATTTVTDARGFSHTRTFVVSQGLARPQALTGAIYPRAGGAAFTYDAKGFVASRTDWNGNVITYTHDARGNETSRTEAAGSTVARSFTTTWLPNFNLPSQKVDPTKTTTYTYDGSGNLLKRTESAGGATRTWSFTYNALGQLLTATDPNGNTTSYAYDAQGALVRATNALGQVTQIPLHDANGRPTKIVDPNGLITTLTYDARGRVLTRNVGGLVTTYTYDATGSLTSVTNPDGSQLTMAYDAAHRLTSVSDRLGNKIVYTLDANGNRTTVAVLGSGNVLSRTVSYAYDEANRVIQVIGALGQVTSYTRDPNGNVLSATNPVGAVTSKVYDALNRQTKSTDANGGVTSLVYDTADRVLSVTDPRSLTTSYSYNGFGDVLQIVSPDSGTTVRTFDANSNLITSTDARGLVNTRAYDALSRLTSIAFNGGGESYVYDLGAFGIGRLAQVSGTGNSTQFSYDIQGRLVQKQQTVGANVLTEAFTFNAGGQLASIAYPSGMTVGYQYDLAGQVSGLTVNGAAFMTSVVHEPFGPARSWNWGSQAYARPHDADGRVASFPLGAATRTLSYDAASQITGYADSTGSSQAFAYDLLGQLTRFTSGATSEQFGYDLDGNRTSLTTGTGTTTYGISSSSNQLLTQRRPNARYVYDAAGNLTTNGSLSFTYDALSRMTVSVNGTAKKGTTAYTTNGLGQRVQKSGAAGTTTFLYGSGSQLMGEYTGASAQETIYLDGMPVGLYNNGTLLRIYADQLGAPRAITNAVGVTQWAWDGDPFGNVAPTGSLTFNQRFPGQYADAETGLFFNHARYYDPKIGRYTQSDPIGLAGGANSYAYVRNRLTQRIDRLGMSDRWPDWANSTYRDVSYDTPRLSDVESSAAADFFRTLKTDSLTLAPFFYASGAEPAGLLLSGIAACSAAAEQLLKPSPGEVIADQLGDIGFHYSGIPEAAQPFVGPVLKYLNSHDVFEAIISYIPPPNPIYP